MKFPARVQSVYVRTFGTMVTADTASGATVIPVEFPADFDENGGNLTRTPVDGNATDSTVYAYTTIDLDAETITLAAATTVDFAEGDVLSVDPATNETRALVRLADSEDEPAVECRVTHALRPMLPEGDRDAGAGESVQVELVSNEWVVTDIVGETPTFDGGVIDPSTLPATSAGSDGNPPASSPTPVVSGGIGTLFVQWQPITNADPVTYEVHVSATSGFTPSGATKAAELAGTLVVLDSLADGSALAYGTTYYVCTVAKDADGSAPASAQASAAPVQATTADIAAGSITANELAANAIVAGKIAAGAIDGMTITGAKFVATGSSGEVLAYSSTPAANNLASSISPVAGVDDFNNYYMPGTCSYTYDSGAALYVAVQLYDGVVTWYTANSMAGPSNPWQQGPYIDGWSVGSGTLSVIGPCAFSSPIELVDPNTFNIEGWTKISFQNGYTDNSSDGSGFRVALTAVSVGGSQWACLNTNITAPSSTSNGQVIGVVPSSFVPASGQNVAVTSSLNTGSGSQTPHLFIDTSGNVKAFGVSGGAVIGCLGLYPLS